MFFIASLSPLIFPRTAEAKLTKPWLARGTSELKRERRRPACASRRRRGTHGREESANYPDADLRVSIDGIAPQTVHESCTRPIRRSVPQSGQETRGACPTKARLASRARTMVRSPILEFEELCMGSIFPPGRRPSHVRMSKHPRRTLFIVAGGGLSLACER